MDYKGGAPIAEHGTCALSERDMGILDIGLGLAGVVNDEIRHVAGMRSVRTVDSVLFAVRVEMGAG